MFRNIMLVVLVVFTGSVYASESFREDCARTASSNGGPRGEKMCECIAEGLSERGDGAEILKALGTPREQRRESFQAMSEDSRTVFFSCLRSMRDTTGGSRPE